MADLETMLLRVNKFVRDKQWVEAFIHQCDVFIADLSGDLSLLAAIDNSEATLSKQKAADLLAYYSNMRIELAGILSILVAPCPTFYPMKQIPM